MQQALSTLRYTILYDDGNVKSFHLNEKKNGSFVLLQGSQLT